MSALLLLKGKKTEGYSISKAGRLLNAYSKVMKEGFSQNNMQILLCELNPKIRPILTVYNKFNVSEKPCFGVDNKILPKITPKIPFEKKSNYESHPYNQYIQYNNETLKKDN